MLCEATKRTLKMNSKPTKEKQEQVQEQEQLQAAETGPVQVSVEAPVRVSSDQITISLSKKNKSIAVGVVVACLIGILAYLVYDSLKEQAEDRRILISGRIEAPETYIAAATATRVQSVAVNEGDRVAKGQLLLTLDDQALQSKLVASGSAIAVAQYGQKIARAQVAAAQQKIATARAKGKGFFAKMFTSKKKKAEIAQGLRREMIESQFMLQQAQAGLARAQAYKAEATSKISYFNIKSPIDGIVSLRSVQPGELVAAGQVLLTLSDGKSIFMKGYIPEGKISRIKIGQKATVSLDSVDLKLPAHIVAIDPTPSFTPENIYFKDDRVRQVFGLKLAIDNIYTDSRAKAGLAAEAEVLSSAKEDGLK
jgi:HlyD family secretion protein